MKKFYVFLVALLVSGVSIAQINQSTKFTIDKSNLKRVAFDQQTTSKAVNDTLGYRDYALVIATDQFYYDPFAFFVGGEPFGGFLASPDLFTPQTFSAEGIIFRIMGKGASSGSTLDSKIYVGAGYYDVDNDSSNVWLALDSLTFNDLDTTTAADGWNTKLFSAPVAFPATVRPFASVDFSAVTDAQDTVFGLLFDGPDFVELDGIALVKVAGTWSYYYLMAPYNYFEAWIIAENTTGIVGSGDFVGGMQLSQNYPNPSTDGVVTIEYALNQSFENVTFEVIDANGKTIERISEGAKNAGNYSIKLNNQLASGMYFYSLIADGTRFTKKMIIE